MRKKKEHAQASGRTLIILSAPKSGLPCFPESVLPYGYRVCLPIFAGYQLCIPLFCIHKISYIRPMVKPCWTNISNGQMFTSFTLWLFNIAMEYGQFIDVV